MKNKRKIKLNSFGFSHVEAGLAIIVIVLVTVVGYRALSSSHADTASGASTTNNSSPLPLPPPPKMVFSGDGELYTSSSTGPASEIKPAGLGSAGLLSEADDNPATYAQDGNTIFFLTPIGSEGNKLYSMASNGQKLTLITSLPLPQGYYYSSIAWSERAQKLDVIESTINGSYATGAKAFTIKSDGTHPTQIDFEGKIGTPIWSPDGQKIAVPVQLAKGYPVQLLVTSYAGAEYNPPDPQTGILREWRFDSPCNALGWNNDISWSSDSQYVYCAAAKGIDKQQLSAEIGFQIVKNSELLANTHITMGKISPDGNYLAYATQADGGNPQQDCRVFVLNDKLTHLITELPARLCETLDWSPNSQYLAFGTSPEENNLKTVTGPAGLWVSDPRGGNLHKVFTGTLPSDSSPVYSIQWIAQ